LGTIVITDKAFAKQVADLALDYSGRLDELVARAREVSPEPEFLAFRRAIGEVLGITWDELLSPIFKAHPDLKPKDLD
jgi:hypothetical protein